ncbi:MAG: NusG domain II-containing protein [Magnetococcales bacterium]|nr:NusG domain II-containing protein [Magnetococcales bacterium]
MRPGLEAWLQCIYVTDRWLALICALLVIGACIGTLGNSGEEIVVIHDAQAQEKLWPLNRNLLLSVEGKLGPVQVEVNDRRVRLLEYRSPRLVGTMTGWINRTGQVTACIPCGVVIQIKGRGAGTMTPSHEAYDGIIR